MIQNIIPSYLYQEYADDPDLPAFISTYNTLAQSYLSWDNSIPLSVYTNDAINGVLLDWVALGAYGITRPSLSVSTGPVTYGIIGSFVIGFSPIYSTTNYVADDDVFKKCLTWNLYWGDGRYCNIDWIKRRVRRFLDGANGTDPGISETYNISIVFGIGTLINIVILGGGVVHKPTSVPNTTPLNSWVPNGSNVSFLSTPPVTLLRSAIETGALQLPFQYRYQVYG